MRRRSKRGMVLLAVLLVIVLAAMIGSTLLVTVDAERSSAETTLRRTQSRAIAWSGVQYVMAQLAEQREKLLAGVAPEVDSRWVLYEEESGRRAVVRLVPARGGALLVSETGKVDLNHASKQMLAALPGIGTEVRAQKIIDARPFTSVEELVRVEGMAADVLYGFVETPAGLRAADAGEGVGGGAESAGAARVGSSSAQDEAPEASLIDLLTVFSFDPNIQAGIESPDKRGKLRINLNVPWSNRFERAVEEQWGSEAVAVVKGLFDQGLKFRTDREMLANVRKLGVDDPEILRGILDAVTTSDDMYRLGRIDILTAPVEVLSTLPGIDHGRALEIVDRRDRLSEEVRLSSMWLVQEGILTLDEYEAVVDLVATRSMQWRVRVEAGFEEPAAYAHVDGVAESVLEGFAEATRDESVLSDRVVYDAVIDVSSERARVAYLREVSMLDLAAELRRADVQERVSADQRSFEAELWTQMGIDEPSGNEGEGDSTGGDGPGWREGGSRIDAARAARAEQRAARAEETRNRRTEHQARASEEDAAQPARTMPDEPVDRRIGRWTSGGGS
ncbi:MAG: hypothetical protein DYG94_05425 [Leptolyngbya sp. PLA3]|nr:MAG: hypothetical protein EDM82_04695 [Cyanobacteria bacterium CYA]MCE7968174.1 hypothetical protein [Leptolyngbya sp. PL-A3]